MTSCEKGNGIRDRAMGARGARRSISTPTYLQSFLLLCDVRDDLLKILL